MWISPIERILNVRVLGARHGTKHRCLRPTDVTLNFDNDQSRASVFLTLKNLDTPWHVSLIYRLLKLNFTDSTVKLGELYMPK
jgi:hypothetical protein